MHTWCGSPEWNSFPLALSCHGTMPAVPKVASDPY